ncbi:MAG: hypothetical protein ABI064_06895 [Acidobacteriaceae bacterium]
MSCANQNCKAELKYLRGGRLFLMERLPNLPHLLSYDPTRPKKPVTMRRYFWLCESCSQQYAIQRWTETGIELVSKSKGKRPVMNTTIQSQDWIMPGLVG